MISTKEMCIQRSFSKRGESLPGSYTIDVDVVDKVDGLYTLDVISKALNIHKTVYSKTLIPICPIEKTRFYHPDCSLAKVDYHDATKDSIWNSKGELIVLIYDEDSVDSLPVLSEYTDERFDLALRRYIQNTIEYPEEAIEADIRGRVYISCIITSWGTVEHIQVEQGIHPLLDNASLDLLRNLKIKTPAQKGGQSVNYKLILPVTFNIQ